MQLDTVLEIAIGLGFTYFLLASMVSFIQEKVASFFKWRGTYLVKAIDVILSNDPTTTFAWGGFGNWFIAHFTKSAPPSRLAASVKNRPSDDANAAAEDATATARETAAASAKVAAPATATPEVVAQAAEAAAEAIQPKTPVSADNIADQVRNHPLLRNNTNAASPLPSYVSGANVATALLTALRDGSEDPSIQKLQATVNLLPNGDLKTILSGFITDAGNDLNKLRARIESWFDTEMDKLSGIYQRTAQYTSLVIGLVLTVVLNVDTLHLVHYLWIDDPGQRAALIGTITTSITASGATPTTVANHLKSAMQTLQGLDLPIGWPLPSGTNFSFGAYLSAIWKGVKSLNEVPIIGLALTTIATALGAPFWFDLVQNITNLRSGTPKPGSSS